MLQAILSLTVTIVAMAYLVVIFRRGWKFSSLGAGVGLSACVVLECCDVMALSQPENMLLWKHAGFIAEAFLPFGWICFGVGYARSWNSEDTPVWAKLALLASAALPVSALFFSPVHLFYSPDFVDERLLFLLPAGFWWYVALMMALVVAMFCLERTYVSLSRPDRWRAKFEIIGTGLILTVLIIYYSQALLYRSLDMNLLPVRSVCLFVAVALMIYSRLVRGEVLRLEVSRNVAYGSVVIFTVGVYLIGIGLFGTGMRYLDITGTRVFLIALGIFAGLGLVLVLLSERFRRRVKVFLHKNFYQKKYDYRNEWLNFTSRMSSAGNREELEAGILSFFVETFALRSAALFLREQQNHAFVCSACHEVNAEDLSLSGDLPQEKDDSDSAWVVDLRSVHARLDADWLRLRQMGCVFLVPLCLQQKVEGFIALGERVYAQEDLTYEDFDLMKALAHQATGVLLSRKLYAELVAANEMAAIGRVSTFVIHDLKNLVSSLALVVDNARDYIDDAEFREDMFATLGSTVEKMNTLIARLQHVKRTPSLTLADADLLEVTRDALKKSGHSELVFSGTAVQVQVDVTEIQKVVLNLIHNAREASAPGQQISVEVGCANEAFIRVVDHGEGMSPEFMRNRLFKPFETTKKKGMGIGLYQCRQIIEGHGGRIAVQSEVGCGSVFTLWLPFRA